MPSFNENPTEFADLNDAFPDLSAQTGLSFEQVRAIGENTYFNKNQNESKASMVANATSGNLAGLDASGNLTDSGVAPSDLQEKMQYSTMPTASASNVGAIVQYIGDTDSTYTNGYFYKCVESSGTYGWEEVISGGGGGGGTPANMVTTNTMQTITADKFFTEKLISGGGSDWFGQSGIGGAAGWSYGQTDAGQGYMQYQLKEVVSTRVPSNKIFGTHISKNDGHIYTARTSNGEDYWEDITPFKREYLTNVVANNWVSDSTYASLGYIYKCDITISGLTANDYAEPIFAATDAVSGNYAPEAITSADTLTIFSKVNTSITIPTIKVEKA